MTTSNRFDGDGLAWFLETPTIMINPHHQRSGSGFSTPSRGMFLDHQRGYHQGNDRISSSNMGLYERQTILNVVDRLILNTSILFEPRERQTPKGRLQLMERHQKNIAACCIDILMRISKSLENGYSIEDLKNNLLQSPSIGSMLEDETFGGGFLSDEETYQNIKLSIDEYDNWISRYIFYRYARVFQVEEGRYTMSLANFEKFMADVKKALSERGLGSDILIIRDVLSEGNFDATDPIYRADDDCLLESSDPSLSKHVILDVNSVTTELHELGELSEDTFLQWFQSVLILYVLYEFNN